MTTTAFTRLRRSGRVLRDLALAALDPDRPVVANLIVTRRCNLSCGYCFEHDRVSPPVPLEVLRDRIDHLARLRTVMVTLTGGEALLHPDLVALVAHVAARGMTPLVNTNGYLLTRDRIVALDRAGLFGMQISVDNVEPNPTSKKSLRLLLPKLRLLVLERSDISSAGLAQLVELPGLEDITIRYRDLDGDAFAAFAMLPRLRRLILGSTAEGTVRHATCSVLVARARPDDDAATPPHDTPS